MKLLPNSLLTITLAFIIAAAPAEAQGKLKPKRDPERISIDEIHASSANNALDLVKTLRPQWLRTRGETTLRTREVKDMQGKVVTVFQPIPIFAYVDGVRFGTHESLSNVASSDIDTIQYLNASSATQRFGTDHTHGAIIVELRKH